MTPPTLVARVGGGASPYDPTFYLWASARTAEVLRAAIESCRTVHGLTVRRTKDGNQVHYLLSGGGGWSLVPRPEAGRWGPEAGPIVPLGDNAPMAIVKVGARAWTRTKKRAPDVYVTWSGTEWVPDTDATSKEEEE